MSVIEQTYNKPKVNYGIYSLSEVGDIIRYPTSKVRYLLTKYYDSVDDYSWQTGRYKTVNFYSLIEFLVFSELRKSGVKTKKILEARKTLAEHYSTPYPFACTRILTDGKNILFENEKSDIIEADGSNQVNLKEVIKPFIKKIEFGEDNLASKFYPDSKKSSVVIDPKHQFGAPIINGTNIATQTIYWMFVGGEKMKTIASLFNITTKQVKDSILFHKSRLHGDIN